MPFAVAFAAAQEFWGDWHGSVEVANGAPLGLARHIASPNTASVDEGITALLVDSIRVKGETLQFEIKATSGVYNGKIAGDGSARMWTQDGGVWPLD